jgi:hypothetical protein
VTSPMEDLLTRAANLRRHLADAQAALDRDSLFDLAKVRYEVETLCELALSLEPGQRARAAEVLEALDADLARTTQHLEAWRETTFAPQQGDDQP